MEIDIDDRQTDLKIDKRAIKKLVKDVLAAEGKQGAVEVSIAFVDIDVISHLNHKFRGIDGPTDVLAFSMDEEGMLGDVVVCPEAARRNAECLDRDVNEEIFLLVIHGLLHLLGYDHKERGSKKNMWARQNELLDTVQKSGYRKKHEE